MKFRSLRLREVADIIPGISIPGAIQHVENGEYFLILPRHIPNDGMPLFYPAAHAPIQVNLGPIPSERYLLADDILFMSRGEKNRCVVIRECPPRTVTPSIYYVIRPNPTLISADFLAWFLNQTPSQSAIAAIRTGGVTPLVQRAQFGEIVVQVPAMDYQQKIADFTSLMMNEQSLLTRLAEMTELRNRAISQQLVTGQLTFPHNENP